MTRISTCDYWAYAYHVLYFSKSVGSTWGKKLDHFYYGRLTSGTPETADFEIVVEDGMGNTYRTSKLQRILIPACKKRCRAPSGARHSFHAEIRQRSPSLSIILRG